MVLRFLSNIRGYSMRWKISYVVLLILFFMTFDFTVEPAFAGQAPPPAPLVGVATVKKEQVLTEQELVGHVEPLQSVELQARVSGLIEQVAFQEGSLVKSGQLLYLIEPAPYRAKVAVAKARVDRARATLQNATNKLNRLRAVQNGGVPLTDIEAAEAAEQLARADLGEAEANLQLADIDLGYTRITAPLTGRIGSTGLTRGNLVGPASGVLTRIVQTDPVRIRFAVSETDQDFIAAARSSEAAADGNTPIRLRLRGMDGRLLDVSGMIDFIDNRIDPTTGTIEAFAQVPNRDGTLLPGQYLTILVGTSQAAELPVVPQAAVLEDRSGRYVLLVNEEDKVEQRRIETNAPVGSVWPVRSGLQGGEKIILQGIQKVRPGQAVKTQLVVE